MKNNLLKYYITAFYLCSTFVAFAQSTPGDDDTTGGLEDGDPAPSPIDNYIWVLALVGLMFVFMKLRAIQNRKMQS